MLRDSQFRRDMVLCEAGKGKCEKYVVVRDHHRAPSWKETRDGSDVGLLVATNMKGLSWDTGLSALRDDFEDRKTEKGYLTPNAMSKWTETVFAQHLREVRHRLWDENAKIVIKMDNFPGDSNAEVLKALENIGNIVVVWLPPHSSHLFKPLHLLLF